MNSEAYTPLKTPEPWFGGSAFAQDSDSMSLECAAICGSCAIFLAPCVPLAGQDNPVSAAQISQTTSQETALHALVEQYLEAYARKDLDTMMALWSPDAHDMAARRQDAQSFFAFASKITLTHIELHEPLIEGEKAHMLVTFDLSAVNEKTGRPIAWLGGKITRSLECVKQAGLWKIWHDSDAANDLAALLLAAKSEQERSALLSRNVMLVTPLLVENLVDQAQDLRVQGEYARALGVFDFARGIATTISYQQGIARSLDGMGFVEFALGKYTEALQTLRKCLAIAETLDDQSVAGYALGRMTFIDISLGDYPVALEHAQKSLKIFESIGDKSDLGWALFRVGNAYLMEGKSTQALAYYSRSLTLAEQTKDHLICAVLNRIGDVFSGRGDNARALEHFQRSLAISRDRKARLEEAGALEGIAYIYLVQNDFSEALTYYQLAADLARRMAHKQRIANNIAGAGWVYQLQGDSGNALEHFHEALKYYEELGNKPGLADLLYSLAALYSSRKDYEQAVGYFDRSLKLSEAIGDQDRIAQALDGMAEAHYAQRNFEMALDFANRASAIAGNTGDAQILWDSRGIAGQAYRALHKPIEARSAFDEAITVVESLRENVAGGEEQQQNFFKDKLAPYHGMIEVLVAESRFSEALSYAERAKGRTLADVLGNGRVNITKAMTAAERDREEEFQAQLVSLNRQLGVERAATKHDEGRLADLKSGLEKTRLRYSDFRTALYAAHPELRAQRGQIEPISPSDAASLLPDNYTAVLEFLVAEEKTYLFVLTRSTGGNATNPELNVHTIDIKAKELDKQTEEFRKQLSLRDLQFRPSALKLFELLVQPAQSQLSGVTSLLIVPDGPLWNLPFQAVQPRPGHYLLEDYALSYAPSLTILREMARLRLRNKDMPAIKAGQTLLAMGNPVLATATSERAKLTYRDERLAPLPEAAREVEALQSLYGLQQSRVFIGGEAAEDQFKAQAGEFRILHLATHGLLNDANPMYSHLLLSSDGPNLKEDGLLEAWEIMGLDLHADLAVLSACETARGRITSGEGVIGLTWAFFVAGVPTTVVSQWKVESTSTTELMLAFHRARKVAEERGRAPFRTAKALQRAELQLLRNPRFSHPFYWAGFVVVGDPQ
jgi:CHAT domain-containing protein/tetratricopeptide (TPR) repeat protein